MAIEYNFAQTPSRLLNTFSDYYYCHLLNFLSSSFSVVVVVVIAAAAAAVAVAVVVVAAAVAVAVVIIKRSLSYIFKLPFSLHYTGRLYSLRCRHWYQH